MIKIPMPKSVKLREAFEWCTHQFGPIELEDNVVNRWDYHRGSLTFYFRDEEDAVMFVLRWS